MLSQLCSVFVYSYVVHVHVYVVHVFLYVDVHVIKVYE